MKPPGRAKQTGRPRKQRVRHASEPNKSSQRKQNTCTTCGGLGHNKRGCRGNPVQEHRRQSRRLNTAQEVAQAQQEFGTASAYSRPVSTPPTQPQPQPAPATQAQPSQASSSSTPPVRRGRGRPRGSTSTNRPRGRPPISGRGGRRGGGTSGEAQ